MRVLVDHGMIISAGISWSCLYDFLPVNVKAEVVLLVILTIVLDPGAI